MYGVFERGEILNAIEAARAGVVSGEQNLPPVLEAAILNLTVYPAVTDQHTEDVLERLRVLSSWTDAAATILQATICPECYRRMDRNEPHREGCSYAGTTTAMIAESELSHLQSSVRDLLDRLGSVYEERLRAGVLTNADRTDASALLSRARQAINNAEYRAAFDFLRAADLILE